MGQTLAKTIHFQNWICVLSGPIVEDCAEAVKSCAGSQVSSSHFQKGRRLRTKHVASCNGFAYVVPGEMSGYVVS